MSARPKQYTCDECKGPCGASLVDFGIGSYEYWGQRCVDTNRQWVSDCCEATLLDPDTGSEADPPGDPRDEYDPERDGHLTTED